MIQKAKIIGQLDGDMVQIEVQRQSACGGRCESCKGCPAPTQRIQAVAVNEIKAETGDMVNVEAKTGQVLLAAAVVYLLPLVLFFGGTIAAAVIGPLQEHVVPVGLGGFVLGVLFALWYNRYVAKRRTLEYRIVNKS